MLHTGAIKSTPSHRQMCTCFLRAAAAPQYMGTQEHCSAALPILLLVHTGYSTMNTTTMSRPAASKRSGQGSGLNLTLLAQNSRLQQTCCTLRTQLVCLLLQWLLCPPTPPAGPVC